MPSITYWQEIELGMCVFMHIYINYIDQHTHLLHVFISLAITFWWGHSHPLEPARSHAREDGILKTTIFASAGSARTGLCSKNCDCKNNKTSNQPVIGDIQM